LSGNDTQDSASKLWARGLVELRCSGLFRIKSDQMESEGKLIETREWTLDPETEYRFELDPGTSLAIKV
jgi:hypothetical protein